MATVPTVEEVCATLQARINELEVAQQHAEASRQQSDRVFEALSHLTINQNPQVNRIQCRDPEFHADPNKDQISFDVWVRTVKIAIAGKQYTWPSSGLYIVQCLIGKAQHLAGDVVDKLNHYQNEEEFFKALRPIFVSPAHQTRARAEYTERTQKPNETLIDYFRGLAALCSDAFPPEDYPTENNFV